MLTDDYLIRMINLALAAMLRIIGLKKSGDYTEALQLIDLTFERLLGLTTGMAKNLDDDRLYFLLTRGGRLDTQRLALVAELFLHEGDIYAATGREAESRQDHARALKYFLEVYFQRAEGDEGEAETGKVEQQIEWLAQRLGVDALPADTLWPLAGYYEESGALAAAEAALLALAAQPELRAEIAPEVAAFYRRMTEKSAAELAAGGLNEAHVRAGLEQWSRLRG